MTTTGAKPIFAMTGRSSGAEGRATFNVPGVGHPCQTFYKIFGDLHGARTPLVVLHGGPGACHDYLLSYTDLGRPTVFYDQLGNGRSTHLREKKGDEAFWTVQLFIDELNNLLRHILLDDKPIDVLGQSWGGMLAAEWAVTEVGRRNLRRLVIADAPASIAAWKTGIAGLKRQLPQDMQNAIDKAERTGYYRTCEYVEAVWEFYTRHLSLARPFPHPDVAVCLNSLMEDDTLYSTMYGPSEMSVTGTLRDWTIIPQLHKIKAKTLLVNGRQDEAQDVAVQPFFEGIRGAKWVTISQAAHMPHVDERLKTMHHVRSFLEE